MSVWVQPEGSAVERYNGKNGSIICVFVHMCVTQRTEHKDISSDWTIVQCNTLWKVGIGRFRKKNQNCLVFVSWFGACVLFVQDMCIK